MGASVHVDIHKRSKALAQRYPLETPVGVLAFLRDIHRIRCNRLRGDIDSAILLTDFMAAYRESKLTFRQSQAVYYRYELQYSERESAKAMCISKEVVGRYEDRAAEKIASTFARMNGGH